MEVARFSSIPLVEFMRDETNVSRFVAFIDFNPVHFQIDRVPSFQRGEVSKKRFSINAPFVVYVDPTLAVVMVAAVARIMASVNSC